MPDSSLVYVPLPNVGSPPTNWLIATSIVFYVKSAELDAQNVSAGSRIVFAGTLAKTPSDFAGSGVTAYHGVGKKAGTNMLTIRVNSPKILRVVGQTPK